jgi:hypothetical protein
MTPIFIHPIHGESPQWGYKAIPPMLVLGHCSKVQLIVLHLNSTHLFKSCQLAPQIAKITNLNKFQPSNKSFQSQNLNKTWIFKVYVFIMFKMKYLINRLQCNTLSQPVWWLDGKDVCHHTKGQGINYTHGVFMVNNGKLTEFFYM